MIIKFEDYLIKESPDHLSNYNGRDYLGVSADDAVGFFIDPTKDHTKVRKLYTTGSGEYHSSLGEYRAYPGRLWKDSKVITFWVYPNPILFKAICQRLERRLKIKILNNNWKVEVVKNKTGEILTKEFNPEDTDYAYASSTTDYYKAEFVPVEEYTGSENLEVDLTKVHLMGWAEKQKMKEKGMKLAPGFGADRTAWDQPRNLKYRQTIYQEKKKN